MAVHCFLTAGPDKSGPIQQAKITGDTTVISVCFDDTLLKPMRGLLRAIGALGIPDPVCTGKTRAEANSP
ncbi:MAG: hypothetical protein KAS72_10410 [Phycisphaerales bacterium]|nr:hypothetical protein [Phycisphaerales bacterium]